MDPQTPSPDGVPAPGGSAAATSNAAPALGVASRSDGAPGPDATGGALEARGLVRDYGKLRVVHGV